MIPSAEQTQPLISADALLSSVFDASEIGFVLLDPHRQVVLWNAWMAQASGIPATAAIGRQLDQLFTSAIPLRLAQAIDDAIGLGMSSVLSPSLNKRLLPLQKDVPGTHRREAIKQVFIVKPIVQGAGRYCLVQISDTTNAELRERVLRQQASELLLQKELLITLINAMRDVVCFKDGENRWLVANQFFLDLFGLGGIDYVGRTAEELAEHSQFDPSAASFSQETDEQAWAEGHPIVFEQVLPLSDGNVKVFDVCKTPLFNSDGSRMGLVVVGRDITERRTAAARIHHLAHHDSLTDLPNRVLFQERLRAALAQARRARGMLALILLDLDKFKETNDTLGHHVGDLLLRAVARRLQHCVRETDTVARLGGDEFAVLLTNLNSVDGASTVAEGILRSLSEPYSLDDNEVVASASLGITVFPDDGEAFETLLKNADLALYRSKSDGRARYHFYVAEMDEEVQQRKAIEHDLRHALGTDQLSLHYQPLIDLRSGEITGAEALIRWHHPVKGAIPPAAFIPIAERSDLIFRLGRWVLHRACMQIQAWKKAGLPPLRVSINLSPAQFRHPDLLDTIKTVIALTGSDPHLLQVEITETIAMSNFGYSVEVLRALHELGLAIAIDDFGTGYSSLNYLKHFPVDTLKIDRSFVSDLGRYPENAAIVKAIINLGHGIGAKVNVEGVETSEQLRFMNDHQCDECQGFYFSQPLPPEDYARLIEQTAPWKRTSSD